LFESHQIPSHSSENKNIVIGLNRGDLGGIQLWTLIVAEHQIFVLERCDIYFDTRDAFFRNS